MESVKVIIFSLFFLVLLMGFGVGQVVVDDLPPDGDLTSDEMGNIDPNTVNLECRAEAIITDEGNTIFIVDQEGRLIYVTSCLTINPPVDNADVVNGIYTIERVNYTHSFPKQNLINCVLFNPLNIFECVMQVHDAWLNEHFRFQLGIRSNIENLQNAIMASDVDYSGAVLRNEELNP